ncbi:hypothetical protein FWD20_03475 [Candidatus Saccharibacteria bacterium]|nr:hypothetical protein [Candidatus Saccharibacteria bacterium]
MSNFQEYRIHQQTIEFDLLRAKIPPPRRHSDYMARLLVGDRELRLRSYIDTPDIKILDPQRREELDPYSFIARDSSLHISREAQLDMMERGLLHVGSSAANHLSPISNSISRRHLSIRFWPCRITTLEIDGTYRISDHSEQGTRIFLPGKDEETIIHIGDYVADHNKLPGFVNFKRTAAKTPVDLPYEPEVIERVREALDVIKPYLKNKEAWVLGDDELPKIIESYMLVMEMRKNNSGITDRQIYIEIMGLLECTESEGSDTQRYEDFVRQYPILVGGDLKNGRLPF